MNPIGDAWRALGLAGKVLAVGLAVVLLAAVWWLVIGKPAHDQQAAAEAKVGGALGESHAASASAAATINDAAHTANDQSETLSRETADVIHHAPGAQQRLDPGLNLAARQRLCLRPSYHDTPECVQLARGAKP